MATIMFVAFGALKSSDAYKTAVARAEADPRVADAIGQPIQEAFFIVGKTEVHGASGESDLTIPIHGPKGKATIHAVATKSSGEWHYSTLEVKVAKTGQTIDLADSESQQSRDGKEKEDQDGE